MLAQVVAQGQPVAVVKSDEAPGRGLEQVQQLPQLQHLAIIQSDPALQHEPVPLLLQAQAQLAQAGAGLDAHALTFRPHALQPLVVLGLQLAEDLQGVLGMLQLPFPTIALGPGQPRAGA
ncbi:hypothetical protein D3C84_937290 [compost metagenome]